MAVDPESQVDEEAARAASDAAESAGERPKLNHKNFLNLFFYIFNIVFTYGIGTEGWLGNGTNGDLSAKYQTIITPKSTAFTIWAVIFVFQAIFAIAQLFPRFRGKPMVQRGVGYWWTAACLMQVGWTLSFAYEIIPLSLAFMLLIWASLIGLLYSQYYTESDGSLVEFWLFRFPFAIHAGWITAASALNVGVVSVWSNATASVQLAIGIVCLAVLHAVSVWVLFNLSRPNYTIACVLSWANGWIYAELQDPSELIVATFDADTISGVAYAAVAVAFVILTQIVIRVGIWGVQRCRGRKAPEVAGEEEAAKPEDSGLVDGKVY